MKNQNWDLKDILKEMKKHATDKEKIFANDIFAQEIAATIYKELSKLNKET